MYNQKGTADLLTQLTIAALGAAVVTSVAIAHGQSPTRAIFITGFSAVAAVVINRFF